MKQTTQSLAEAIKEMAQHTIKTQRDSFAVIDCPLHIHVSSDHSEIHMRKGELHLMVALNGDDAGIYDCNSMGYAVQNPYWINSLKPADVIADIWAVSYNIDKFMSQHPKTVAS
jgi:archaellum component FlaG (FlaF/FlaG flagellin family)